VKCVYYYGTSPPLEDENTALHSEEWQRTALHFCCGASVMTISHVHPPEGRRAEQRLRVASGERERMTPRQVMRRPQIRTPSKLPWRDTWTKKRSLPQGCCTDTSG